MDTKKAFLILLILFSGMTLLGQNNRSLDVNFEGTWKDADVDQLVKSIEGTPFPKQQLDVIRAAVDTSNLGFTADQTVRLLKNFTTSSNMADAVQILDEHILGMRARDVKEVLDVMKFPQHQLRALEVLRFTVTDEANKFDIVRTFSTQKHKDQATKILKAMDYPRSYIYGTIKSKHITFIVDVSGSMATEFSTNSGASLQRLDFVRQEMEKVLKGFNQKHKFNIIFFSSDVDYWKKSMVNASPSFRQDALDFVNRTQAEGATNLYGAMKFAFKDPEVHSIYLLTDGMPTTGEKVDIRAILGDIRDWNNNDKVRIHTTALLTGGDYGSQERQAKRFMRRMARQNDGIFREIR